jgi:hypothetical protein
MSNQITNIKIEDNYYVNDSIESLKSVYLDYWKQAVSDLKNAYDNAETEPWVYYLLYDSDLFSIFKEFPSSNLDIIKAFISFNNNPCAYQLSSIIKLTFEGVEKLTVGQAVVTIDIDPHYSLENISIKKAQTLESLFVKTHNNTGNVKLKVLRKIGRSKAWYVLKNFLPVGVKLIINTKDQSE